MNKEFTNLIDLVRERAQAQPNKTIYTFLSKDGEENNSLTYGELDQQAKLVAAYLQQLNLKGERALLLYDPGLDFIISFFGCIYAGVIAVPAYPPKKNRNTLRIQSIVKDCNAKIAMTTSSIYNRLDKSHDLASNLKVQWITMDNLNSKKYLGWINPRIEPDDLAFLQYTSGSTGTPKGVMVSHGNLIHNERMIANAFELNQDSIIFGWLPLYHDMGLIGNILQPLYLGATCYLMSPVDFVQNPYRWLKGIEKYKATVSGGPNFAYDLCVKMITPEQRDKLDLSNWKLAFNGAEPIREKTIKRFSKYFKSAGFEESVFYPCYGLAESTLLVTGGDKHSNPTYYNLDKAFLKDNIVEESDKDSGKSIVSNGQVRLGQDLRIVDPTTKIERKDGEVGEIWVSGPSVAKGYWNNPELSKEVFEAKIYNSNNHTSFLRTGDLGFKKEKELYVTGRLKDLIIVRGKNHYPQDIEMTAENSHYMLSKGASAAFTVEVNGREELIIVQEVEREYRNSIDTNEVSKLIRAAVSMEHNLKVYEVVIIKPLSIPKTSSGKIQRYICRESYLNGTLKAIGVDVLGNQDLEKESVQVNFSKSDILLENESNRQKLIDSYLKFQIKKILRIPLQDIQFKESLSSLGVDSIQIVEIKHNIEKDLGVIISEVDLLEDITLNNLSKKILQNIHEEILISQMGKLKKVSSVDDEHPLSYNQKTMWYLQELSPNNSAYNISFALTFKSSININRFKDSMQRLLERHSILRTIYHQREDRPVQKILKYYDFRVETLKCANWSERQLKEEVNRIAQLPFDIKKDIPIRVFLLEKNNKETVALFTFHHIAVDLWSITLIMNELEELYLTDFNEKSSGQNSNLYNYVDYVYWQKEMLENSNEEKSISYWAKKLGGDLPVLELPTDYLRPNIQTYNGNNFSFEINPNVTEKLKKLAKLNGTTLNNILMAAYKVWLHRYTGQDDLLVGIPSAGRGLQQLNNVVGYFVNPLVVRTDFSGNPTFIEVLNRVKRNMLDAITHQDYPFPLLVEKLKVRRDNSRHPIFQTMFVMQALHKKRELSDFILGENKQQEKYLNIPVESFPVETNASQLDLTLKMVETPKGLRALFEYNTDLFKQSTIEKMSKHLINILENVAIKPDEKIGNYSLLTQEEEKTMLKKCNNTAVDYPKNTSLSKLFEEQVTKTPDNIAVVYKQQTVTYRKLNKQANQLARVLREKGIQPDVIVGIMAERSVEMIIGILAVLKAGGTYLPIDPEYPVERIEYMMEDSQASILLTQEHLLDQITFNHEVLNIEDERLYQGDCSNLEPVNSPNDLAYIIYTSGTTGNAKGVMIEHKNVVRLLFNDHDLFDFNEGDVWTLFHSFCFDFSVWEMYGALLYGGRVVVVPKSITQDPKQFLELLKAEKVTVLNQTPTAFYHLIAQEAKVPDRELDLRYVIFGGEALQPIQLRAWWGKYPNMKLINMYGITETTVHVTFKELKNEDIESNISNIGRPLPTLSTYVMDKNLNLLPLGAAGELCIGGEGVARGYLNRPKLTKERFVKNPYREEERLYRSGDLGRLLPNGEIEYLGRIDHQVKIRGYRIELGEIECHLLNHEKIKEAIVIDRTNEDGSKYLCAYLVLENEMTVPELREYIATKLPNYMVPSYFVQLEKMPITVNGKINRNALPKPSNVVNTGVKYVAPRDKVERVILDIWKEVLSIEQIGMYDNFFELGGHSLLAANCISRIRNKFEIEITLEEFFNYPTIALLKSRIQSKQNIVSNQSRIKRLDRAVRTRR